MSELLLVLAILLLFTLFSNFASYLKSRQHTYVSHLDTELAAYLYRKHMYLKSSSWHSKRQQVLKRDNYCCQICGRHTELNVHHLRYNKLFNEPLDDLLTLCTTCHTQVHESFGYPQTILQYNEWNHPFVTKQYKLPLKDTHVNNSN